MIKIVLDTNILVSALWKKNSKPASIVQKVLEQVFTACYDYRILNEYINVLHRPKFSFASSDIKDLLEGIKNGGLSIIAPESNVVLPDEDDRMFYDVAEYCDATLITGNTQHFPKEPFIVTASDFLDIWENGLINPLLDF